MRSGITTGRVGVQMQSATVELLSGVWGSSSDDVYAVGSNGAILHYSCPILSTTCPRSAADLRYRCQVANNASLWLIAHSHWEHVCAVIIHDPLQPQHPAAPPVRRPTPDGRAAAPRSAALGCAPARWPSQNRKGRPGKTQARRSSLASRTASTWITRPSLAGACASGRVIHSPRSRSPADERSLGHA